LTLLAAEPGGNHPAYVDRFFRQAGVIEWDQAEFASARLDTGMARILHVGALLEDDTAITIRQGRALGIDRSPDISAFLPVWDAEEAEHGRALHALLSGQRYDAPIAAPLSISLRRRVVARVPARLLGRLPQTAFLFCVLGAAAEYLATVTYTELAKRDDNPAVVSLLRRITRQEARHFAFFLAAAHERAEQLSSIQGRISRRVLEALWEPIGVPSLGRAVWEDLFADWIADPQFAGRLRMMDRVLDDIPHIGAMHLMGRFLDDTIARTAARPARSDPR
jgi:hypothetical protein